ncbi:MAG: class I SAM-dependent methyltransferase [Lachnospiraceae bacterium]|nr:class I SAM-dependent methyltransferase [Lachnospiraceae bacterium]
MVEFITSMKYIHDYLGTIHKEKSAIKIIDIGAGTGRYSVALAEEGYDVTAVELAKHNLGVLKAKKSNVKAFYGNAVNLKRFDSDYYDITILFGPMYHLISHEDKVKALLEAKRVTKQGGYIFVAYCMNEYSVLTYGFKEHHVVECVRDNRFDDEFNVSPKEGELYDYVRIEEIDRLNKEAGLERVKIITPDGPANYMRQTLNSLTDEEYDLFIKYHLSVCERRELLGAAAHTVDILKK